MLLVVLSCLVFGGYNLLPHPTAQLASALLFGPTRTTQWACYFHFLSLPRRYPSQCASSQVPIAHPPMRVP